MTQHPQHPSDDQPPAGQSTQDDAQQIPGTQPPSAQQTYGEQGASTESAYVQPAGERGASEQAYGGQTYREQGSAQQAYGGQAYGEQGSAQQAYGGQAYQQPGPGQAYGQPGYPQGAAHPMTPSDERTWSIAAHLSPFLASFVGLPFLGPLVIYLIFRDRGPYVRHHAAQALNFQIIVAIGLLISIPLMFVIIGFVTAAVIGVAAIVFQIVAAVEANNGKWYRYPLTPDWVK